MKIEDVRRITKLPMFRDLHSGQAFMYYGAPCIKTEENCTKDTNATRLTDGKQLLIGEDIEVKILYNAKVVIENE